MRRVETNSRFPHSGGSVLGCTSQRAKRTLDDTAPFFVFCQSTVRSRVTVLCNSKPPREDMMDARWTYFKFTHQFTQDQVVRVDACSCCFARWITGQVTLASEPAYPPEQEEEERAFEISLSERSARVLSYWIFAPLTPPTAS